MNSATAVAELTSAPARTGSRLLSLDVLRGLTVAFMILVNNAGDGSASYSQLRHSVWNGCTLTDLVFPIFLFIVGASIYLSFERRLARGVPKQEILLQVVQRSILIFVIGLLLNALPFFQLGQLRYYGVLQRIAICYGLASVVYLAGGITGAAVVVVLAVALYWWLMLHVRVPGYGLPGLQVPVLDPSGNLASWLDRSMVPPAHMYRHTVYDPEGLLSSIPALGTTLFGVLAGRLLRIEQTASRKLLTFLVGGILLVCAGLLWSRSFPINKRVWTSSYVLFTAGISMLLLGLSFWAIDGPPRLRRGLKLWVIFGTNALAAYIFSEVLAIALTNITLVRGQTLQQFMYRLLPGSLGPPPLISLVYSLLFVGICFLPVLYLHKHDIILRL